MTKPIDPEIKALRALVRAIKPFDLVARRRMLEWFVAAALAEAKSAKQGERR